MAMEQVEPTLTSFQDQTGITTKLQKNHPEEPTEHQPQGSLITKDLWKKNNHHNETGRKCGGARGLSGLPWTAAEVPEGCFRSWGRGFP